MSPLPTNPLTTSANLMLASLFVHHQFRHQLIFPYFYSHHQCRDSPISQPVVLVKVHLTRVVMEQRPQDRVGKPVIVPVGEFVREVDGITVELVEQVVFDLLAIFHGDLDESSRVVVIVREDGGSRVRCACYDQGREGVLTSWPGQPIQVNCIVFLHPESAETRPPEDIYERV